MEEVGAMNIFFVINGMVVTPALTDSILAGITRASIIATMQPTLHTAARTDNFYSRNYYWYSKRFSARSFWLGTAAVVSPVGSLRYNDVVYTINNNQNWPCCTTIFGLLTDIQYGVVANAIVARIIYGGFCQKTP